MKMALKMAPEIGLNHIGGGAKELDCKPSRKLSCNKIDEDNYLCCDGF